MSETCEEWRVVDADGCQINDEVSSFALAAVLCRQLWRRNPDLVLGIEVPFKGDSDE